MSRAPRPALPSALLSALLLAGCASSYDLVLMPRSSGKTYVGEAVETAYGEQANVRIDIEGRVYTGTWVATTPGYGTSNVSFGFGIGMKARRCFARPTAAACVATFAVRVRAGPVVASARTTRG